MDLNFTTSYTRIICVMVHIKKKTGKENDRIEKTIVLTIEIVN